MQRSRICSLSQRQWANFLTAIFADDRKWEGRREGGVRPEVDKSRQGWGRGQICQIYADVLYGWPPELSVRSQFCCVSLLVIIIISTYYINLGVSSWIVRMLLMRSVFCWSTTTACQRNLRWWQRTWSGSSWSPRTAVRSRHARCRRWQQQARRRLQAEFWRSLVGRRGHVERLRRSGWWRWWRLRRPDWRPDRRSVTCSCRLTSTTAQRMTTDRRP